VFSALQFANFVVEALTAATTTQRSAMLTAH
jgi:hypothetical protein